MAASDCPKLRPLRGRELVHEGQPYVALECPFGLLDRPVLIAREWFHQVVRHFDGKNTLLAIQARILRETSHLLPLDDLKALATELDRALALESPAFARFLAEFRNARIRPASHAGLSYAGSDRALRAQLARYFSDPRGAGEPGPVDPGGPTGRLRGILSPHIDFGRGGTTYTWAYRELVERSDADVFVILGVAHSPCRRRFALTRKDFQTPLGLARTDQDFLDALVGRVGDEFFGDELAHRREHSVEFQVVFLQYLLGTTREFSIVPILVGSFHDLLTRGIDPIDDPEVAGFVAGLKAAESGLGRKVAYIGGIDLCHVGPEFGDPAPVDAATLDEVRRFDAAMLDRAGAADPAGWFGKAAEVGDRWRVCGLAATYTMIQAMGPARGRLLRYEQAVDDRRTCCVSFASLAFDEPNTEALTPVPEIDIETDDPALVDEAPPRAPCPAPADFRREVEAYDRDAVVVRWDGPRYRMTARALGEGPPLILVPGVTSTYRGYCLTLRQLAPRFRTVVYDYPGDRPDDGARLSRIGHDDLVDDVFGLIEHLNFGRAFLFGLSFGSTIVLKSLRREPRRFPRAAIQGGFAHRGFTPAEKVALRVGRLLPGNSSRLPLHEKILAWNNLSHFPSIIADRWPYYVEQNGLTPIRALTHRLDLIARLDLRPILPEVPVETLLVQGNEDRIVGRRHFDELKAGLPKAEGLILPIVGHQPHYTHAELLARVVGDYLLPCAPGGCPNDDASRPS